MSEVDPFDVAERILAGEGVSLNGIRELARAFLDVTSVTSAPVTPRPRRGLVLPSGVPPIAVTVTPANDGTPEALEDAPTAPMAAVTMAELVTCPRGARG